VLAVAGKAGNPARRRDSGYRLEAGLFAIHAFCQPGNRRTVSWRRATNACHST
jgi:hypothetical protein